MQLTFSRVRMRSDPDVAPGWHRLLYLKAFTYTACSANKGQTCKSQINRATVGDNFDFATQVAEQFRTEQLERYRDRLSTQLRPICRWARPTSGRGASSSCRPTASTTWTP